MADLIPTGDDIRAVTITVGNPDGYSCDVVSWGYYWIATPSRYHTVDGAGALRDWPRGVGPSPLFLTLEGALGAARAYVSTRTAATTYPAKG